MRALTHARTKNKNKKDPTPPTPLKKRENRKKKKKKRKKKNLKWLCGKLRGNFPNCCFCEYRIAMEEKKDRIRKVFFNSLRFHSSRVSFVAVYAFVLALGERQLHRQLAQCFALFCSCFVKGCRTNAKVTLRSETERRPEFLCWIKKQGS